MRSFENIVRVLVLVFLSGLAIADENMLMTQSIPTLDEVGLIGLIALVGVIAGWIIKRNGK